MAKLFGHVIYKITFPNGKIYVGKDVGTDGHSIRYFGTWNTEIVENDFTKDELKCLTLTKEIIFESDDKAEVSQRESGFIVDLQANDPDIGYNRWPQFHKSNQLAN